MNRLVLSISGGKTSAYMAHIVLNNFRDKYDEIIAVFANTGQEREETLQFVNKLPAFLGVPIVWLEASVNHGIRKGTGFKIVDFECASRDGFPFEEVIKKYGIPNKAYPHCTRELKLAPITSYLSSIGWVYGSYDTAIGIRSDELSRIAKDAQKGRKVYPLAHWCPSDKIDVNDFWEDQSFNLDLESYEGNCSWCWKKSLSKHFRLIDERPEIYDFPKRMESIYGLSGHNIDGNKRVFFRQNMSTNDLFMASKEAAISIAPISDPDAEDGCSSSCEAFQ